MKIHEYQAKQIHKNYGVKIPRGLPAFSAEDAIKAAKNSEDRRAIERQAKKVVDLGTKQTRQAISKLKKQGGRKAAEIGDNVWRGLETSAFELGKLSQKIKAKVKRPKAKKK